MPRANDNLGDRTPVTPRVRRSSLSTRVTLGISLLALLVSGVTIGELTRREWDRLLESKRAATDQVAQLFAGSLAPALARGDAESARAALGRLRHDPTIVYAAVYAAEQSSPLATHHGARDDTDAGGEGELQVQSGVFARNGASLGSVVLRSSLAQEVQAYRRTRARLVGFGLLLAAAFVALTIAVLHRLVLTRLARLEAAARELAAGQRRELPSEREDELGSLSRALSSMAASVEERERRIASQQRRLAALFENMAEAIVIFGSDRLLTEDRSLAAERWLDARPGNSITDILYPEDDAADGERQAFEAWLDAAFAAPADQLREVLGRGPRRVTRSVGQETVSFELSFRLAEQAGSGRQLMLIALDVTRQRELERSASESERSHERELSSLRLLTGGAAPLFSAFLERARRRLASCRELLVPPPEELAGPATDQALIEGLERQLRGLRAEARRFDLEPLEAELAALRAEVRRLAGPAHSLRGPEQSALARGLEEIERRLDAAERGYFSGSPCPDAVQDQLVVRRSRLLALLEAAPQSDRVARLVSELAARPLADTFTLLPEAVGRWARQAGKQVELELESAGVEVPLPLEQMLGGVLSQLLHDVIVDEIEPEAERVAQGKPAAARLRLWAEPGMGGPILHIEHDGRAAAAARAGHPGGDGARESAEARPILAIAAELLEVDYEIDRLPAPAGARLRLAPRAPRTAQARARHAS